MPKKTKKSHAASTRLHIQLQEARVKNLRNLAHDWEPSASESSDEGYYDIDDDASCDEERNLMWDFLLRRDVVGAIDVEETCPQGGSIISAPHTNLLMRRRPPSVYPQLQLLMISHRPSLHPQRRHHHRLQPLHRGPARIAG